MTTLLEIKELITSIYKKFEKIILPIGKFIVALMVLIQLNGFLATFESTSKLDILSRTSTSAALAVLVAFMPGSWFVLLLIVLICAKLFFVSIEATLVVFIVLLVLYLMFVRLFPKFAYLTILVPIFYGFKLGYLLPIFAGIFIGPAAIVPISVGVIVFYMSRVLPGLLQIQSAELFDLPNTLIAMYRFVIDSASSNRNMILTIFVFALVIVVTYLVSQIEMDFVWYLAIGAGAITNIFGFIIGNIVLNATIGMVGIFVGTLISAIIVAIMQFFRFSLDYQKAERVQFEDDEYFYYVKAIPKIKITKAKKEIKTIK